MRVLASISAMSLALACAFPVVFAADATPNSPLSQVDYTRDIKPILLKHCAACHGAEKQKSGLRLDTAAAALEGGDSGPAIIAGKSGESLLIQALMGAEGVAAMPPQGSPQLTVEQIALVRTWIDQG